MSACNPPILMEMSLPLILVYPHAGPVGVRLSPFLLTPCGKPNGRVDHSIEMEKYERNRGFT